MKNVFDSDWRYKGRSTGGLQEYMKRNKRECDFSRDQHNALTKLNFIMVYFVLPADVKEEYAYLTNFYRNSEMRKWLNNNISNKKGHRWRYGYIIYTKNNFYPIWFEDKDDALKFKLIFG